MELLIWYLTGMNVITFLVYVLDKRKARKGAWRTRESVLILLAFAGGSVGALLGMHVAHHKTNKMKFRIGIPCILLLQIAAAILTFLYYRGGAGLL